VIDVQNSDLLSGLVNAVDDAVAMTTSAASNCKALKLRKALNGPSFGVLCGESFNPIQEEIKIIGGVFPAVLFLVVIPNLIEFAASRWGENDG